MPITKIDAVAPLRADPPQAKYTTKLNLPICNPSLYIIVINKPIKQINSNYQLVSSHCLEAWAFQILLTTQPLTDLINYLITFCHRFTPG